MTQKDYELIAGVIRGRVLDTNEQYALGIIDKVDAEYTIKVLAKLAIDMATALTVKNNKFKPGRFFDACGLGRA